MQRGSQRGHVERLMKHSYWTSLLSNIRVCIYDKRHGCFSGQGLFKNAFRIDPSSRWIETCETLEMAYIIPRSEDKIQACCSNHGNRSRWEDQVPRPKQGKLDVPRHFFILLSRESEQDKRCSHFFPAHPSLQSHLPQLHWPWPAKRKKRWRKQKSEAKWKLFTRKKSNNRIEEKKHEVKCTPRCMCGRRINNRQAC